MGREERQKQKNRFVSGGSRLAPSQAGGRQVAVVFRGDTGTPAPVACPRGFWGNRLWPAWASSKPRPCSPSRPRPEPGPPTQVALPRSTARAGIGSGWPRRQPDLPPPGGGPRREARLAQRSLGTCRYSLSVMSPRPWAYSRSRSRVTSSFSSRISLLLGSSFMTALQRICLARSAYLGGRGSCGLCPCPQGQRLGGVSASGARGFGRARIHPTGSH